MVTFAQRAGLPLLGLVVVFTLLFVFSRREFMIDLGLTRPQASLLRETTPTTPPTTPPRTTTTVVPTPPYYTSPNQSILFYAQSRFASQITDTMFKAKQQVLDSLCVGKFKGDLTADEFWHDLPQARALYSKWSNQSKTNECVANRRMYLVGTSFQRSIAWSLLRWLMGRLNQIPPEYKVISSVPALVREKNPQTGECDANVNGTMYDVQPLSWPAAVPSCMLVRSTMCEDAGRT
ncbi:hypothetical protein BASA81_007759 [Batrachochytrium salamandrivorans]|nr:hypothetical protein BASA81_007759 [Batrachochytrium salamandrivorans]